MLAYLLALYALCATHVQAQAFAACTRQATDGVFRITSVDNPSDCAAYCLDRNSACIYSYFRVGQSGDGAQFDCQCSGSDIPDDEYTTGDAGACQNNPTGTYTDDGETYYVNYWDTRITDTSFALDGCYSDPPVAGSDTTDTGTPYNSAGGGIYNAEYDPKSCTEYCGTTGHLNAIFYPTGAEGYCRCDTVTSVSGSVTCGTTNYHVYSRGAAPAEASLARRRSLRERLQRRRQEVMAHCPNRLTACAVRGASDAFECIDVQSELESCGGCLGGQFGASSNTTLSGTDCSALPGIKMGAVTCLSGECVASACRPGWKLVSGQCARA